MLLKNRATLFLVATPIGNLDEMSFRAIEALKQVDYIACEDTRNSGILLAHYGIHTKTITYHNFNEQQSTKGIIALLSEGKNVALISDAGYPLISDPGYELVNSVIDNGFDITVISGSNAGLSGLIASGLPTTHYLFYGFLNPKASQAKKQLEQLKYFPYTLIFYEAPHRIEKTLDLCLEVFGDRKACLARELSKIHEQYHRGRLSDLVTLHDLKGEMVLIIQGYEFDESKISLEDLLSEVNDEVKKGIRSKQAINQVAEKYNYSKNVLYDAYIKNKK